MKRVTKEKSVFYRRPLKKYKELEEHRKNMRDFNWINRKAKCVLMLLAVGSIGIGILYELRNVSFKNLLIEEETYTKNSSNEFIREEQDQVEDTYEKTEIKELHVEAITKDTDELVFSIAMSDFIESYNGYYYQDYEKNYLQPASSWSLQVDVWANHSPYKTDCYHFTADRTIWSLPTIDIYVPSGEEAIQEITLNFDDHSYNPAMYEKYEEMCFYTLKVFFPDLSNEQIIKLYTTSNEIAYDHMLPHEQGYHKGAVPAALFYRGDIGVYPYFAAGECVHLCIMPVTTETLKAYEKEGVEIYEIQ